MMQRFRSYCICRRWRSVIVGTGLLSTVWITAFIFLHHEGEASFSLVPLLSNTTDTPGGVTFSITKTTTTTTLPSADSYVPLVMIFTNMEKNSVLLFKLLRCLRSIFVWRTPVNLILISDTKSFDLAESAIKRNVTSDKAKLKISYLNLDDAVALSEFKIETIKREFNGSSFSQTAFFLSTAMHVLLPFHSRVLYVDVDTVFHADISLLFRHFDRFTEENLFGLMYKELPVYKQAHQNSSFGSQPSVASSGGFREERKGWPPLSPSPKSATAENFEKFGSFLPSNFKKKTRPPVGPSDGLPVRSPLNPTLSTGGVSGFNGGVVMFDLNKIRGNRNYLDAVEGEAIGNLAQKFAFRGLLSGQNLLNDQNLLSDENVFTLLAFEHPEWFYVLPCDWNGQLCVRIPSE